MWMARDERRAEGCGGDIFSRATAAFLRLRQPEIIVWARFEYLAPDHQRDGRQLQFANAFETDPLYDDILATG